MYWVYAAETNETFRQESGMRYQIRCPKTALSTLISTHIARRRSAAHGGSGDVYSPATGTWTSTGPVVLPYASDGAALLPNGQVLYVGGTKVKYSGQYACDEPIADAELYTP